MRALPKSKYRSCKTLERRMNLAIKINEEEENRMELKKNEFAEFREGKSDVVMTTST